MIIIKSSRMQFTKNILRITSFSAITTKMSAGEMMKERMCKIRDDKFQSIELIPNQLFNECLNAIASGRYLSEYKVRIPLLYVKRDIWDYGALENFYYHEFGRERVLVSRFNYSYDVGLEIGVQEGFSSD